MNIKGKIRNLFKRYACVMQSDITDCGAACLATISRQYGLKIPISKIREIAGTDKRGTNGLGMVVAAQKLGFRIDAVKGDKESFFEGFTLPAIAHIINKKGMYHFVVIHSISKEEVIIADPDIGIVKYSPEEFFLTWTGVLFILSPDENFEKGNQTKNIFQRFSYIIASQKKLVLNIFLASMLCNAFGIAGSFIFKLITDEVVQSKSVETLYAISIGFIVLSIFKILFEAFRTHLLIILSQNIDISLILNFYKHLVKLPMKFFDTRKVGEIVSRFQDSSKVREAVSSVTLVLMIDTIMAVAGGVILYIQNAFLFGITGIMIVLYAIIVFLFNKPIRDINQKMMENSAQLTSFIVESINGAETVKSFTAEDSVIKKTEDKFINLLKSIFKNAGLINIQHSLSTFVTTSGTIIILLVGASEVIKGSISLGQLLGFNALLVYFFSPISNLINIQPLLQGAIVASNRLGEILDIETESENFDKNKIEVEEIKGNIEFNDVSFKYGNRDFVIKNTNLEIRAGEKIAIVGRSGSGKTTLAKLIMNFYTCQEGDIFIDGINIKDISKQVLREQISYVPQNTFLFSDTVMYNLTFMDNNDNVEDITKICELTKSNEFIDTLPSGYDSVLEENGSNLSGGQRQRLSIARALIKKPKILIMDEATSSLDSVTERAVQETIDSIPHTVTKIVIAHRLSTIINCDRIIVMQDGKIVEMGAHTELMNLDGMYKKLVKEQLSSIE